MVGHAQSLACKTSLPSPRIYTYPIPGHIAPPPTHWRNVRALKLWLERSRFHEDNPFCADYFHISTHPNNRDAEHARSVGDQNMVRLMDYIRMTWPFWNQSVRTGRARHFMVLPCDHGPGDCAYSRPLTPNKYSPVRPMRLRQWGAVGHETITDTWGDAWETINPASPNRLLIYLLCMWPLGTYCMPANPSNPCSPRPGNHSGKPWPHDHRAALKNQTANQTALANRDGRPPLCNPCSP